MSTFQQQCPGCGRALELPTDARGRLGKCPACEATFTIGADRETPSDALAASQPDDPDAAESPTADQWEPDSAPHDQLVSDETLQVTAREIEEVLAMTLAIFRARFWAAILPLVIVASSAAILVVLPLYVLNETYGRGFVRLAISGLVLVAPFSFMCSIQMWLFLARSELAVARNQQPSMSERMPSTQVFLRGLGISSCLLVAAAVACLVMYLLISLSNAAGAVVLGRLLQLVTLFVAVALWFGLLWYSWAWLFVCGDGKGTMFGSIRAALAISQENKLTSFFLVLITIVLSLVGTLTCLVGHLVTAPLNALMFAVAYLMMTGQTIADPNVPVQQAADG